MSAVDVVTFGCRLNISESEVMRRRALEAGLGDIDGGAIVFNTCAVTAEAVRQARQAIRRAKRDNPDRRIVVSGCAAQSEPGTFGAMEEVDLVIGNEDKLKVQPYRAFPEFGVNDLEKVRVNDIFETSTNAPHMVEAIENKTRAFVQVQNGCDHRCTFCIIPFGRGPSRSVPLGGVIDQVRALTQNNYREIVLTGVDLTSWGNDLPGQPSLGRLVQAILDHTEVQRLRLSSIDSIEVDPILMSAFADVRVMPHLHLSLQHGDDIILKRMKRRHGRYDAVRFCENVREVRPDMTFGADIIAGFPTETPEQFQRSLSLIDDCGLTFVHVFPFSPRDGTPASRMPQIDRAVVKQRAARLRGRAAEVLQTALDGEVGHTRNVLIEADGAHGRSEHFHVCHVEGEHELGSIVPVSIVSRGERTLQATPIPLRQAA